MIITLLVVKNMEDFEKFGGIARRYPEFEMANRKLKKELVWQSVIMGISWIWWSVTSFWRPTDFSLTVLQSGFLYLTAMGFTNFIYVYVKALKENAVVIILYKD